MKSEYIDKTKEELLDILEQKDMRIIELENQLKQHGIFVVKQNEKLSGPEKIIAFLDYFHGRMDLYAERYYSKKNQKYGWSPVCDNSFAPGCPKKSGRFNCFQCLMQSFTPLTDNILKKHFTGTNQGIGIYPMMPDHTCFFLAIDFDEDSWFEDMLSVYRQAVKHDLYPVMERSQSGLGGHLWFFFAAAVKAREARRLGEILIQEAMNSNRNMKFSSFDRMFPNQDYVPENGAGNLIALPLRYDAYLKGNSAFIDDQQRVIQNPIEYLISRKKITSEELSALLSSNWNQDYFFDNDQMRLSLNTDLKYVHDLYGQISSCIRIEKRNLNAVTINLLCRAASMYNPKYYEMQRLHKAIYLGGDITRVLSYFEEDSEYLYLPRGIIPTLQKAMPETEFHFEDCTQRGENLDISFKGALRDDQLDAAETMLKYDMGILQAVPGFGKTVVGIYLMARLKVNTLILVDNKELQDQWEERIEQFLEYPHAAKKKDRFVCRYGSGSKKRNGKIDIAMVRSLKNAEDLAKIAGEYGLTIVDECHHVACESFLHVMRFVKSRYIYGLSATPKRDDGLFKVITMYCGPIRKRIGRESIRSGYSFKQYLIPRYTNCRSLNSEITYAEMCSELMRDQVRNYQIVKDVLNEYRNGSNIIVLSERVEHLSILLSMLEKACSDVYLLSGEVKKKERKITLESVRNSNQRYVLLATSKLLGEGFDLASLNCLFLVLPISSDKRITQYTGRIHRTYAGKDVVKVYDYIDAQYPIAQSMYYKRLQQYKKEGYLVEENRQEQNVNQILFEKENYEEVYLEDLSLAKKEIIVFITSLQMIKVRKYYSNIQKAIQRGVAVQFVLSPALDLDSEPVKYLKGAGSNVVVSEHQKHFTVIDRSIVWNFSFCLLGNVPAGAFATRDVNARTAQEIIVSIQQQEDLVSDKKETMQLLD